MGKARRCLSGLDPRRPYHLRWVSLEAGGLGKGHSVAKAELQAILLPKEKIAVLRRDAGYILNSYAPLVPARTQSPGPEERHLTYKLSKLRAEVQREAV